MALLPTYVACDALGKSSHHESFLGMRGISTMSTPVPILLYHSVAERGAPRYRKWAVRPDMFIAQMRYLHENGYTPITVTQFVTAISELPGRLPKRPVVLTFDDGFADFYSDALPILINYGFVATLYLATGFIGQTSRWLSREGEGLRPMLTWQQVAELSACGIECGAHSHTHLELDTLPYIMVQDELARSKSILQERIGLPVYTFAYPHGYYTSQVRHLVQQTGYSSACAVKHAMSSTNDDMFALARIIVSRDVDLEGFAKLLAGQHLRVAPKGESRKTKVWRSLRFLRKRWRPQQFREPLRVKKMSHSEDRLKL